MNKSYYFEYDNGRHILCISFMKNGVSLEKYLNTFYISKPKWVLVSVYTLKYFDLLIFVIFYSVLYLLGLL